MAALSTEEVLRDEANAIHGKKLSGKSGNALYRALNELNSAALCLSGGGIRSASFALGVIQALAVHPRSAAGEPVQKPEDSLLAKFHYLSTVSGGGYIGSWLTAWITRAGFPAVWRNLIGRPDGPDIEPSAIGWLRSYSNYLTPKLGITSADAWAAVAIYIRNLLLNWLVLLPVLCVILISLKLFAFSIGWIGRLPPLWCEPPSGLNNSFYVAIAAGLALLIVSLRFTTRNRPTRGASTATQSRFLWGGLLPAVAAAVFVTIALAIPCGYVHARNLLFPNGPWLPGFLAFAGVGALAYAAAWLLALPRRRKDSLRDLLAWMISGLVYGLIVVAGVCLYYQSYGVGFWIFRASEVVLLVFGVSWLLAAQLIAEMIFVGLTSYQEGSDSDREWLARAAGWYMVVALVWLVLMFLFFVGLDLTFAVGETAKKWLAAAGGVSGLITVILGGVSGLITLILGKSSLTLAKGAAKGAAKGWLPISTNVVLAIAAPIFAVALTIFVSALLDRVLLDESLIELMAGRVKFDSLPPWLSAMKYLLIALVGLVVIGIIASRYVNINRFSLHALYRNRSIRAFLGASRTDREATRNPFTDFDVRDNPRIHQLWQKPGDSTQQPDATGAPRGPFHIVNIALNIVSSEKLAWQERKAEPFTVSPLHSGSSCVGFRRSEIYGDPQGISVGTAITISGAAASPNMGYHSSPPLALLMTLFNVRLGWWLGNPKQENEKIYRAEGPRWAIVPLLSEMFGLTTDEGRYVNLSDGGHFENLGLYEMVRRRCRFILVSDAGCDPKFEFEDLGNAVRKIEIDLGVKITFAQLQQLKTLRTVDDESGKGLPYYALRSIDNEHIGDGNGENGKKNDAPYYAVGTIEYPAAGDDKDGSKGIILYLKPAFHGTERNVGIQSYAMAKPDFPHENTADQWFSESQFESYRALGFEITNHVLEDIRRANGAPEDAPSLASPDAIAEKLRQSGSVW